MLPNPSDLFKALMFGALVVLGAFASTVARAETNLLALSETVVAMVIENPQGYQTFCSAVVVAPGKAYTAAHCVGEPIPMKLYQKGGTLAFTATVSKTRDFAVLDAPGLECPCAPVVAGGGPVPLGNDVAAVGYPGGKFRLSTGVMYGRIDILDQRGFGGVFYAFSARVDPGSSGGALFAMDDRGNWWLIGIVVAYVDHQGHRISLAEPLPR